MNAIPNIHGLTPDESRIAAASLKGIALGPWFDPANPRDDDELKTIVGFHRSELQRIHARVSSGQTPDDEAKRAINNCLLNLVHYPGAERSEVPRWLAASFEDVEALYEKWSRLFP
ncbi:MAG: hypothetical protein KBG84_08825 [Planctomycetes bacterium]|nr:hypothetical protein [Planctomycetota bacterium]